MNKYGVIVIDPPWAYGKDTGRTRTAEHHYQTIGNEGGEINRKTGAGVENIVSATPVNDWAAKDCHMYLWVTNPKLPFAFSMMAAWGFEYKTAITWLKTKADGSPHGGGMGWFYRGATEHVLLGVKGNKGIPSSLRKPNVVLAQPTGHSTKPVAFYELLRSIYDEKENMMDAYARTAHYRFDAWGFEAPPQSRIGSDRNTVKEPL